jgi:methylated-DNA-[protein]-cysteine S-methyltransferase
MPVPDARGASSVPGVHSVETPIGPLLLSAEHGRLSGVTFAARAETRSGEPVLLEAEAQLHAYFAGELERFELPLTPRGTAFQLSVWEALLEIPYGRTTTYSELAAAIGRPSACRAVGAANGRNPLAVIVPCHRVIGAAGALTGYGGGLERKRLLLALEAGKAAESHHGREEPPVGATV